MDRLKMPRSWPDGTEGGRLFSKHWGTHLHSHAWGSGNLLWCDLLLGIPHSHHCSTIQTSHLEASVCLLNHFMRSVMSILCLGLLCCFPLMWHAHTQHITIAVPSGSHHGSFQLDRFSVAWPQASACHISDSSNVYCRDCRDLYFIDLYL